MTLMSKILISTGILLASTAIVEAKTVSNKSNDYTIRKDSLSTTVAIDTNKKVILFPNPFNLIIYSEEKK